MSLRNYITHRAMNIKPLRGKLLAELIDKGERTTHSGVILLDDNMKEEGVRPRWFKCQAVGDEVYDINPGDYILVSHGRWTREQSSEGRKIVTRVVEADSVLAKSDVEPEGY